MPPKKKKKTAKKKGSKKKGTISSDAVYIDLVVDPELLVYFLSNTKLNLPKAHLSPSAIGLYLNCPRKYFFRYVYEGGIDIIPGATMVEGTTHHGTCEYNNLHKIKTGRDRTEKQLIQHFEDTWHENQKEITDWQGLKGRDVVIRGRKFVSAYLKDFAPRYTPRVAEREYVLQIGPVKILCYMDTAGTLRPPGSTKKSKGNEIVCDYKIASRAKPMIEINTSFQLTTYGICDMADRKEPIFVEKPNMPDVGMCVFKKIKKPAIEWQAVRLTTGRINWLVWTTLSVADAISRGAFPVCNPADNNLCDERWCGYWKDCFGHCTGKTVGRGAR